jgi:hypothetical protein
MRAIPEFDKGEFAVSECRAGVDFHHSDTKGTETHQEIIKGTPRKNHSANSNHAPPAVKRSKKFEFLHKPESRIPAQPWCLRLSNLLRKRGKRY